MISMDLEHIAEDNSLSELVGYKIGINAKRIAALAYLNFSAYRLHRVIGHGAATIVFFEDLVHRPDHLSLLYKIQDGIGNSSRLLIFKRFIAWPRLSLKRHLLQNAIELWRKHLHSAKHVIVFCPHTIGGFLIQEISRAEGQRVYALQHGYYSYSNTENLIFSKATRAHKAFIFDSTFDSFFAHCDETEAVGTYFSSQKILPIVKDGIFFHIPYLNSENAEFVKNIISQHRFFSCSIRFHPRQELKIILDYLGSCLRPDIDDVQSGDGTVGTVNHFIETSAWHGLENDGKYESYFHRAAHPTLNTMLLNAEDAQHKLIQSLTREIHGNQS